MQNKGNPRPGAPHAAQQHAAQHEMSGRGAIGSFDRQTHEQSTVKAQIADARAGEVRGKAETVSGSYLVVRLGRAADAFGRRGRQRARVGRC
jgi:hypothetical protein